MKHFGLSRNYDFSQSLVFSQGFDTQEIKMNDIGVSTMFEEMGVDYSEGREEELGLGLKFYICNIPS